jgi:hypothetical protein
MVMNLFNIFELGIEKRNAYIPVRLELALCLFLHYADIS